MLRSWTVCTPYFHEQDIKKQKKQKTPSTGFFKLLQYEVFLASQQLGNKNLFLLPDWSPDMFDPLQLRSNCHPKHRLGRTPSTDRKWVKQVIRRWLGQSQIARRAITQPFREPRLITEAFPVWAGGAQPSAQHVSETPNEGAGLPWVVLAGDVGESEVAATCAMSGSTQRSVNKPGNADVSTLKWSWDH